MKYVASVFLILLCSFFWVRQVSALSYLPTYNSSPPSGGLSLCSDMSGCGGSTCFNSEAVGVTSCGTACSGGNAWSRYEYSGCYQFTPYSCQLYYTFSSSSCSTADKCVTSDGPYLRAGFCSCTTGGIYKVCCNPSGGVAAQACVQVSNDGIDPPWEGICPAGSYSVIGDASSCPQIATSAPLPTSTPPPTPTTATSGICSGICGGASNPPGTCTPSGGGTGTWQWVGGEPPYTSTCGSTGSTPYCYRCVASGATPTPTSTATGGLDPGCPNIDKDGRPNQCVSPGACTFGYTYKNSSFADNACATFVTLDPGCPNTDLDGRPNECTNSCSFGYIQKGGSADAACQAFNGTRMCCHNYAPKWCCHQNPPATPTPVQCAPGVCGVGQNCATCPIGCGSCPPPQPTATPIPTRTPTPTATPTPATFTISGNIFIDNNSNGIKDIGETNYSGGTAVVSIVGRGTRLSDALGNYSFTLLPNGNYTVSLSTIPTGYTLTSSSPLVRTVGPNQTANFGIKSVPPPVCTGGMNPAPTTVPAGSSITLSVTSCTDVKPTPTSVPPPPFSWQPDTNGNNPPPTVGSQTDTPTSSTVTWTAPNCPSSQQIYVPKVTVAGFGGTASYTTNLTVPATYSVSANVRLVSSVSSCLTTDGTPFDNGTGNGANVNLNSGAGFNQTKTTSASTGTTSFTCLPGGDYQLSLQIPEGYGLVGTSVTPGSYSTTGSNGLSFTLDTDKTATFCIAQTSPWFQTDKGDVRFSNLRNPVPLGQYGSLDVQFPGIYYSSNSNANTGIGAVSVKNWVINNEFAYNSDIQTKNGSMSYDFYKFRSLQTNVQINQISSGTLDMSQITGSGVYESDGDLTINLYTHVNGRRVVLLVNGNVTINSPIRIQKNQGVLIIAAKKDILIDKAVGVTYDTDYDIAAPATHSLDGYYSAQGSIVVQGDTCTDGTTPDLRLNLGGAFVANSLKPFAVSGIGTIQNKRSVCSHGALYPSLFVSSRPDFLTQLTNFYKSTYSKWQEVGP